MKRLQHHERTDLKFGPRLALRFYADARPHTLQTARLHKGAIVVCNGTELVEEGLGIGVPVCTYRDGTRFSLSADTFLDDSDENPTVIKIYNMNGIASKRFRRLAIRRGSPLAHILKILEKGYRDLRRFRTVAVVMMDFLSLFGMRNEYLESRSRGQVVVTYRRSSKGLKIEATLDGLSHEGLRRIVIANEQGGSLFNEYEDSTGIRLNDRQIEPWRMIQAEWASLRSRVFDVGFRITRPRGWLIARGREMIRNRISWSGLDLLCGDSPQTLEYWVEIVGEGID